MKGIYNQEKLPENYSVFVDKTVTVVGAGAVGSYLAEFLAKMEVGKLRFIDFDCFTRENAAKHSALVRVPEDTGGNKARIVAKRAATLMIEGGTANGMDANITMFGPMAFTDTDIVILAVDNFAAKIYFNQIWLQIPEEKRPLLIYGGTIWESAQSNCLDGKEACMRCLMDESWLDTPKKRTSCSGPQFRVVDGVQEIVRTSGLASSMSAHLMAEAVRGYCVGEENVINKVLAYFPYPNLSLMEMEPMKRCDCPDCKTYCPPKELHGLEGNVCDMTLGELFEKLEAHYEGADFVVNMHVMEFAKIGYGGLIVNGNCPACGKDLKQIYRHESRTYYEDMICEECKEAGREAHYDAENPRGDVIRAVSPKIADDELKGKTLFELGWPVGGFIKVVTKTADAIDALDDGVKEYTYYCLGDNALLDKVQELK